MAAYSARRISGEPDRREAVTALVHVREHVAPASVAGLRRQLLIVQTALAQEGSTANRLIADLLRQSAAGIDELCKAVPPGHDWAGNADIEHLQAAIGMWVRLMTQYERVVRNLANVHTLLGLSGWDCADYAAWRSADERLVTGITAIADMKACAELKCGLVWARLGHDPAVRPPKPE